MQTNFHKAICSCLETEDNRKNTKLLVVLFSVLQDYWKLCHSNLNMWWVFWSTWKCKFIVENYCTGWSYAKPGMNSAFVEDIWYFYTLQWCLSVWSSVVKLLPTTYTLLIIFWHKFVITTTRCFEWKPALTSYAFPYVGFDCKFELATTCCQIKIIVLRSQTVNNT